MIWTSTSGRSQSTTYAHVLGIAHESYVQDTFDSCRCLSFARNEKGDMQDVENNTYETAFCIHNSCLSNALKYLTEVVFSAVSRTG